ncbi:PAS domain S-box protein [Allomesorhizobium camelthorni]|uniref:PAS domain S-box protein n=1 Tax=Allomesorhizobium camelthorni TaxID=475069 RepID=A0A6G4WJM0_9HYPH|nr:PAS domain S-box protein [Mesorhizobium camelthorni]NGO54558.1 PAS domain S-box protein [Mesorhizobium camelthorni]
MEQLLYSDTSSLDAVNAKVLREGEWSGALNHRRKDGTSLVVEARCSLLRDDQDNPRSILAVNTDITHRLAVEQELCWNLGDEADQAALCGFSSMNSIPSWNLAPAMSFGN